MPSRIDLTKLAAAAVHLAPFEAAELLRAQRDDDAIAVLQTINPFIAQQVLAELPDAGRARLLDTAPADLAKQWNQNQSYPEDSAGRLMDRPVAVFRPQLTVKETIAALRKLVTKAFITYSYVTDEENRLLGVITFRDLMLAGETQRLEKIMVKDVFALHPDMALTDAMKATLNRHYPVYPVCDDDNRLLGLVRGQILFEARTIELSAQPGTMVGVDNEERFSTPMRRSLFMRHPWLQVNLLTAFLAAAVVSLFQDTIDRIVILAAFLPVLAGQSGNTGCQSLAVCIRGLTLGDLKEGSENKLFVKEAFLGLCNGALVGVIAAVGMFAYARIQGQPSALLLALVVFIAMILSCIVSGVLGASIPLVLRRFGADPATASSIFLTTATDVVSMGTFLALATFLIK